MQSHPDCSHMLCFFHRLAQFFGTVDSMQVIIVPAHTGRHVNDLLCVVNGVEHILGHVVDVANDVAVAL